MRTSVIWILLAAFTARADWVDRYQSGEELLRQGRAHDAIVAFRAAANERPDRAAIFDGLGRAEMSAGQYRSARGSFEKAVRLGDKDLPSLTNLAIVCITLGDHHRAEQILTQVLATNPENRIAKRALAQALHQQGRNAKAASILEDLLASCEDDNVGADLSVVYEALHKPAEARAVLVKTIPKLEPGRARARLLTNLGVLHWKMGARNESEVVIRQALVEMEAAVGRSHPDTAWILEQYGHVLRGVGRKKEARDVADRAANIRSAFVAEINDRGLTVDWRDLSRR